MYVWYWRIFFLWFGIGEFDICYVYINILLRRMFCIVCYLIENVVIWMF